MGISNREWLYSLDPHALTEWFESEHFECPTDGGEASMMSVDAFIAEHTSNDTLGAKNVISGGGVNANDANVSEHVETANGTSDGARAALDANLDSRAKLEDDVREFFDACFARVVLRFIDRQAAITEREHVENPEWIANLKCSEWMTKAHKLQEQVDELTEQRDRWRENWNRRNVEYSDLVNEFEELRDEKTKLESTLDVILDALADYWLPDER